MLNNSELYVLDTLAQATHCLATGAGRIQERLEQAFRYLVATQPADMSDCELRRTLAGIKNDLTFDEPKGIRWGPNTSSDKLRQCARCTTRGHKGAAIQHAGWGGNDVGFLPFPTG
jgi:hypothetical protein